MADRYKAPKNNSDEGSDKDQDKYNFDDLDKEVGLGDILKEKDSVFMVMVKKITFIVIIVIVSIIVFFASFTIGKMMFMTDQSELTTEGIPSENIIESTAPDTIQTANGQEVALTEKPLPPAEEKVEQPIAKPIEKMAPKPLPKPVVVVAPKKEVPVVIPTTKPAIKPVIKPIVKPIEKPVAKAVTPEIAKPNSGPSMMIVAGTFSKIENANLIKTKLSGLGFAPTVTEIQRESKTLLRVIAGTFPASEAAKKIASLRGKGIECFAAPAK